MCSFIHSLSTKTRHYQVQELPWPSFRSFQSPAEAGKRDCAKIEGGVSLGRAHVNKGGPGNTQAREKATGFLTVSAGLTELP